MTQILRIYTDKINGNPSCPCSIVKRKIVLALFLMLGLSFNSYAQISDSGEVYGIVNPVILPLYNTFLNQEYRFAYGYQALPKDSDKKHSWLYRKLYLESLFIIKDTADKFYATIDPLFNFQGSIDHSDSNKKYYQNTRGILIQGNVGDKFAFSTAFWENQASYPTYLNKYIQESYVIPGNGRPKAFGKGGWDFSMSEAYMTFSPSSHFSFQAGYGKNFIGDGYRSLLLSDNSFVYPYVRITTTYWHLQYTNLYAEFMDPFADPAILANDEGLFQRKAGAFQYLSWNIVPQMEWGIFQGMIWTAANQDNQMSFNANYFDPVIGINALNYGLGNTNNVLLGSTLKYKINKNFMAYGQLLVNDLPKSGGVQSINNQTGYQAGIKYFNAFGEFQLEYNQVRPYTYSNKDSLQNYSHYNQALGDPLGANFRELIGIIHLRYHHFSLNLQANYALEGLDSAGINYGNNIFLSGSRVSNPNDAAMLQGVRSTLMYMDAHISYLMNPRTNMNVTIGISRRTLTNSLNNEPNMTLIYIGFRTSIENMYVDF